MKNNKTEDIRIRVTKDEKDIIVNKAKENNMSMSNYIRLVGLNAEIKVVLKNGV